MEILGKRIRELREEHSIFQDALAGAIGVSKNSIYNYENGKRLPDAEVLVSLAGYFNVSTDYLLGLSAFKTKDEIADIYRKKNTLEELIDNESPSIKLHLIGIFTIVLKMYNLLRGAEMKTEKTFLQDIFDILSCIDYCCEDAEIITEGVYHMAYDNLDADEFDVYAGEVLDLSVKMKTKAHALISKIMDDIRHEAIGKLADYYGLEPQSSGKQRKLDQISDKFKERKMQGGESCGNNKAPKE